MPGEFDFISWLSAQTSHSGRSGRVATGVGDDLAVLRWTAGELVLVGVDQVLDGVHFQSAIHSPREIGRKVMNRNLSDCAAMGCHPAAAVATVALPQGAALDYAQELYRGLREAADPFDCPLVGGDTASWRHPLAMTVTVLGRLPAGEKPVTRGGAQAGDALYVSGRLGGSILGRHMTFSPRVALGAALRSLATSMIDLSDGLSRDLGHLCMQSGVGAIIEVAALPIHPDAETLSRQDHRPALAHALHDGEDHELLFTASKPLPESLAREVTKIGRITRERVILLDTGERRVPLEARGWEHRL